LYLLSDPADRLLLRLGRQTALADWMLDDPRLIELLT